MVDFNARMNVSGEASAAHKSAQGGKPRTWMESQAYADTYRPVFKLADLVGKDVIITKVWPVQAMKWEGWGAEVTLAETGEKGIIAGQWKILSKYLSAMSTTPDLPIQVKIVRNGKSNAFDFE